MKFRILQIDDDPMMLKVVGVLLARDGAYEIEARETARDGIRAASEWLPDLVLCDVSMPDIGGLQVLEELQSGELTAHLPVVFTTARAGPDDIADYLARGAAGVIVKPFDIGKLSSQIRGFLDDFNADGDETALPPDIGIDTRLRDDTGLLHGLRDELAAAGDTGRLRHVVHKLAGVAGIYGYAEISDAAATVEAVADRELKGAAGRPEVIAALDRLLGDLDMATRAVASTEH